VIPPADALAILRDALPGWGDQHDNAIQLLLVGALRAQYAPPLPSTLLLTGDTGSGKSALVSLAAGILGVLSGDIEGGHGTRELGMALGQVCEEGRVFAHVDEIGKIRGFWGESSPLLRLSTHLTWRKLYVGRVTNVNRTMLVLSGSTLPGALPTMAEFARRLPVVDLPRAVADWSAACREKLGCTALSAIRSSSPTSGARIVADALYDWACQQDAREIADWVQYAIDRGAERLTAHDDESLSIAQVLRELYQLWTEGGPEEFFPPSHPRYGRGYLDATQLDQLGGRTKASRLIAPWANAMEWMGFKGRLETAPLNGILGVEAPELRVRITRHNVGEIAIRFGSREGKGKVWKWAYAEKVVTPVTRATAE